MKLLTLSISIFLLLASSAQFSLAEDTNDEVYRWQHNEFGQISDAYKNEIQQQIDNNPELDPTAETKEDIYQWQHTEFPQINNVYKDEIQANLDAFHVYPKEMTQEESLTWQRKEFPQINDAYDDTFKDAALQTEKLKEIRASKEQ